MDDIKWNKVAVKCYKILHFVSKSSWIKVNLLLYDFSDYHFLNSVFSRYATHWNNKKKRWKETNVPAQQCESMDMLFWI